MIHLAFLALATGGCASYIAALEGDRIRKEGGCFGPWDRSLADVHAAARRAIRAYSGAITKDKSAGPSLWGEGGFLVASKRHRLEGRVDNGQVTVKATQTREPGDTDTRLACVVFAELDAVSAAKVTAEAAEFERVVRAHGAPPDASDFEAGRDPIDDRPIDWMIAGHWGGHLQGGEVGLRAGLLLKLSHWQTPWPLDQRYVGHKKLHLGIFGEVHGIGNKLWTGPSVGLAWWSQDSFDEKAQVRSVWLHQSSDAGKSQVRGADIRSALTLDLGVLFDTEGHAGGFLRAGLSWPPFYGVYLRGDLLDHGAGLVPGIAGGLEIHFPDGITHAAKETSGAVVATAALVLVAPVVLFIARGLTWRYPRNDEDS